MIAWLENSWMFIKCHAFAGIVIFGGCATFTALASLDMSFSPIPFGYSFYLGWVSGLLFILSGIFTIVLGNTAFSSYFS